MSKKEFISRYLLIIRKLRRKPYSSFEELLEYVQNELELNGESDVSFSKRTLQRDIAEIRSLFNIEIAFSHSERGYYIEFDESENMNFSRMIEAYDIFQSLNQIDMLKSYFHFEGKKPAGTEYIKPIVRAIKTRSCLKFNYFKNWNTTTQRTIEPLVLKEYKARWYLFGREKGNKTIKTFALDRIQNIYPCGETFLYPSDFDAQRYFTYCFGIYRPIEIEIPEKIIFTTSNITGKYLLSQPMHQSQILLRKENEAMTFQIQTYITPDLIMEFLSLGENVYVEEPVLLKKKIIETLRKTLHNYSK